MSKVIKGEFAIGTKVRMSQQGKDCWGKGDDNPHDLTGVTIEFRDRAMSNSLGFVNRVRWDNGCTNAYMDGDLEVVQEEPTEAESNHKFKVGDVVVYIDNEPQDEVIFRGDVGIVRRVDDNYFWPFCVDFGKGGCTSHPHILSKYIGLAPMSDEEVVSVEEWLAMTKQSNKGS